MKYLFSFLFCIISSFTFAQSMATVNGHDLHYEVADRTDQPTDSEKFIIRKSIKVYPNPARHTLFISGYYKFYNVFDEIGRRILTGSDVRLDVTDLKPGMYVITIHDGHGEYQAKKILIQ